MFSFFRQIRQKLLTENRVSKYLLYAIGEILLVVIGILIALQVDNWNEERKKQREISQLLLDIEKDLLQNYGLAEYALAFYKVQDSIARRIARHELSEADYRENARLSYFISNWEYYLPAEKNIDQFVESEKLVPGRFKPVIEALKRVQSFSSVLDDTWSNLEQNIDDNSKLLTSHSWFVKNDSISNARRMEFFLQEETYEIAALGYWVRTQNYFDKITRYRAQTTGALATIKRIRDGFDDAHIKEMFHKMGMPPFASYPCGVEEAQLKSLKAIRSSELYGNLPRDTLHIELTNNRGQAISEFIVLPTEFVTVPGSEYFGIEGDYNTLARVSTLDGKCVGTFGAYENGYLLITENE